MRGTVSVYRTVRTGWPSWEDERVWSGALVLVYTGLHDIKNLVMCW